MARAGEEKKEGENYSIYQSQSINLRLYYIVMITLMDFAEATLENATEIVSVTNEAFIADAFFKKQEYHLRFTHVDVIGMISSPNSVFILAKQSPENELIGSIFLHWRFFESKVFRLLFLFDNIMYTHFIYHTHTIFNA